MRSILASGVIYKGQAFRATSVVNVSTAITARVSTIFSCLWTRTLKGQRLHFVYSAKTKITTKTRFHQLATLTKTSKPTLTP